MKTNRLFSVRTALATSVAGAVLLLSGCGQDADGQGQDGQGLSQDATKSADTASERPRLIPDAARDGGRAVRPARRAIATSATAAAPKRPLPDATARFLVENAVNENDYKSLSVMLGKLGQIEDPEVRLRLLHGLAWFDETAATDALPFLSDPDGEVAAAASDIVSSRISLIPITAQRGRVYGEALATLPDDSPDRELLLTTLESDRKSVCIELLHKFEGEREERPDLWRRLTEIYEEQTGLPYTGRIDALLRYDPGDDR